MNKETIKTVAEKAADGVQKTSWPKWVKVVATVAIAAAAALASLYLTGCTVTPAQAAQLQAIDAAIHAYAPYIITVEPLKK